MVTVKWDKGSLPYTYMFYPRGPKNLSLPDKNEPDNLWGALKLISHIGYLTKISKFFAEISEAFIVDFVFFFLHWRHSKLEYFHKFSEDLWNLHHKVFLHISSNQEYFYFYVWQSQKLFYHIQ